MIETLTKLFEIKIVARRNLGLSNKLSTFLSLGSSLSFKSSNCPGEIEKKATSEPETIAEKIRSRIIIKAIGKI